MKNLVIVFLIIMLGSHLQAQNTNEPSQEMQYKKQIGFNFTDFVLRFLSFNESTGGTPSILALYKKGENGKKWRYGFGGRINWAKRQNNSTAQKFFSLNFSIGKEYHQVVANKWTVYFGWEILPSANFSKVTVNNSFEPRENSELRLNLGGSALIGMQYNFNERISILTESSYILMSSYQKDQNSRESYSFNSSYRSPISLILNYHF